MLNLRLDELPNRALTEFGSDSAAISFLARGVSASVVRIELGAGGVLGMHPAAAPQLFAVVEGEGSV